MTLPPLSQLHRGILMMLASSVFFAAAWAAVKMIGTRLPVEQVIFFRSLVSLLLLWPLIHFRARTWRMQQWNVMLSRTLFGAVSMYLGFYSFARMDLGDAAALINTTPLFVALLAPWMVKERFQLRNFIAMLVAFGGVLLIIKPGFASVQPPMLAALACGLFTALSMISVRQMRHQNGAIVIVFYFTLCIALLAMVPCWWNYVPPTPAEWGWMAFIGLMVTIGQLLFTTSYQLGEAATMSPFGYAAVLWSYLAGIVFWGEVPDMWSLMGGGVLVGAMVAMTRMARKRPMPPGAEPEIA